MRGSGCAIARDHTPAGRGCDPRVAVGSSRIATRASTCMIRRMPTVLDPMQRAIRVVRQPGVLLLVALVAAQALTLCPVRVEAQTAAPHDAARQLFDEAVALMQ